MSAKWLLNEIHDYAEGDGDKENDDDDDDEAAGETKSDGEITLAATAPEPVVKMEDAEVPAVAPAQGLVRSGSAISTTSTSSKSDLHGGKQGAAAFMDDKTLIGPGLDITRPQAGGNGEVQEADIYAMDDGTEDPVAKARKAASALIAQVPFQGNPDMYVQFPGSAIHRDAYQVRIRPFCDFSWRAFFSDRLLFGSVDHLLSRF